MGCQIQAGDKIVVKDNKGRTIFTVDVYSAKRKGKHLIEVHY